jgi:4-hydroxy-tetrahydrodipicolinate synthase
MPVLDPGLIHAPATPFTREQRIDYDLYGKLIGFHLRNGADSLALPMHAGESVSLTDVERRALLEFAIKAVGDRAPVIAHVSEAGTGIAAALACHAEDAGAAAIIATTPYYWTPPATMLIEHFAEIGSAVTIPFYVYNSPEEMHGTRISTDLCLKLIDRLPNFAGVIDLSLDWQFMIELLTYARRSRPDFQLLAGTEHLVSAAAIGASGMLAPLAGVAPKLTRELYELCRKDHLVEARPAQEAVAAVRQLIKPGGVGGLKAALRAMGRDCGEPRPPLRPLDPEARIRTALEAMPALRNEPHGW